MRQNMDDSGGAQCREATLCIKAPKFSGKTDWEAFKARFELLAMAAGWSEEHKALQLAMCLTDDADACLLLLSPEERKDYGAQVRALQRRYGQINQPLILRSEFINRRRQPELQKTAADMFGMEAALFCISVSMGNLIAVMAHCMQRGDEMIVGDVSHLHVFEQGASAQLAGVHSTTVTTLPDGTFDLDQLESKIRHGYPNAQYPRSRLICLENTHTIQGGRVLPLSFLQEVRALADQYGLSVHMDGARVMNAAVAQGVPLSTILQHTHTVSVCLSKGLGAPVGSVLAGSQDFISRATRCRKALGGGMWLAGMLAAAAKVSLQNMVGRLVEDHHNAKTFAQALLDCQPPLFAVDVAAVETNIVRFRLQDPSLSPPEFCARMAQVGKGEEAALGQGIQVLMYPFYGNSIRAVWHHGISPEDTQLAIQKMRFVASQHLKEKVRAQ